MREFNFTYFIVLMFLFAFSSCKENKEIGAYSDYDEDGDQMLNSNEVTSVFDRVDYFNKWDVDEDDFLDDSEWHEGINRFIVEYDEREYGTFDEWDGDSDLRLSKDEFHEGIFNVYDADNDDNINGEEYTAWYSTLNEQ